MSLFIYYATLVRYGRKRDSPRHFLFFYGLITGMYKHCAPIRVTWGKIPAQSHH